MKKITFRLVATALNSVTYRLEPLLGLRLHDKAHERKTMPTTSV